MFYLGLRWLFLTNRTGLRCSGCDVNARPDALEGVLKLPELLP